MRGRSCSREGSKGGMEMDKLHNLKEEPHLSGAYIRSLVKQLTSSRTKDSPTMINPKNPDDTTTHTTTSTTATTTATLDRDEFHGHQNLTKFGEVSSEGQQQSQQPPQQHKKQVRRRLHTSRPYQERLLNMAEARREIVTALKFHRAAMKQADEKQHQPPLPPPQEAQPQQLQPPAQQLSMQEGKIKSKRNPPRIYPSSKSNFSNYLENISYSSQTLCCSSQNPYSWPASQIPPPPPPPPPPPANAENLNINLTLPNQTLGLNLNFQDFNNLNASMYYQNCNNPSSIYSSSLSPSSSSTSPSPTLSINTDQEVPNSSTSMATLQQGRTSVVMGDVTDPATGGGLGIGLGLHPAMDDQEMAEIRSIGEQHEMEWNDTLNLVTSAWWFKFFKTTKIGPHDKGKDDNNNDDNDNDNDDDGYFPFDEVMEFPAWLNNAANDTQHYLNDHCLLDDYLQAPALPCMDIGEIEGMDAEWLT